jgi:hypothetical protein
MSNESYFKAVRRLLLLLVWIAPTPGGAAVNQARNSPHQSRILTP